MQRTVLVSAIPGSALSRARRNDRRMTASYFPLSLPGSTRQSGIERSSRWLRWQGHAMACKASVDARSNAARDVTRRHRSTHTALRSAVAHTSTLGGFGGLPFVREQRDQRALDRGLPGRRGICAPSRSVDVEHVTTRSPNVATCAEAMLRLSFESVAVSS